MDKPPCMNLNKNRAEGCRYWQGLQNSIMKCMVIEFLIIFTCLDHQKPNELSQLHLKTDYGKRKRKWLLAL